MLYAVLFEDNPEHADKRPAHMPAHLAFLTENADRITSAGPMFQGDGGEGAGGLWLVEAEDADAVQALVEADPFWPTGLRKSVQVLRWQRVFADGAVLIAQK
jgi:uncharacterized protein YciI